MSDGIVGRGGAMGARFLPVGRVLGVPLRVHVSWFVTLSLLTVVLASGPVPRQLPAAPPALHLVYGLLEALLLFASVLVHELAHALMGRRRGLLVAGITLRGFGGVAEFSSDPASAPDELWVTLVGPATSYALALAGGTAWLVAGAPSGVTAVLGHFVVMNVVLATFNVLPGFPLDGGRLLRAALWAWHGDYDRATRSASRGGMVVATVLVMLGVLSIRTDVIAGLWLVGIALYLRRGARAAEAALAVQRALEQIPVRVAMRFRNAAVPADTTVDAMVRARLATEETGCAVLGAEGTVVGIVTSRAVAAVAPERRSTTTVSEIMGTLKDELTTAPAASCWDAFRKLQRAVGSRLLVFEEGRLVGTLALDDLTPLLRWSAPAPS